jgi:hypothetical protein
MSDEFVDRAIDEVAHEMTAGEPRGDLRARVMHRVTTNARRGPSRYLVPAFAAAAIVIAVMIAYRAGRPEVRLRPDTTTATTATTPPPLPHVGPVAGLPPPREAIAHTGLARSVRRVAILPSPIDALAPPPLTMDSLTVDRLSAAPLDVTPLDTVAPIVIAPLGDEGDRR